MSRLLLSPPDVGPTERRMLLEAFDSGWIAPTGPDLTAFEAEVATATGARRAVALSSGTAGLHLALSVLGVGPGDRVWLPSFTFVATANAVTYTGAQPVLVDSDPSTWTIDADLVAEELARAARRGTLPAVLVSVDIFGQCADYDRLREACDRFGVAIVEDAAEALGSTYRGRKAGALGDVGVVSFNGNKIVTTGGGGMLLCDRDDLADQVRHLSTQAREPGVHYQHELLGYNYRLPNLLAAVGRAQLRSLDEKVAARRHNFAYYAEQLSGLPGVGLMPLASYGRPNCWLTCLLLDPADCPVTAMEVVTLLTVEGIEARPVWKPMHLQPLYADAPRLGGDVCTDLYRRGLCLPSGSAMREADLARVVAAVRAALQGSAADRLVAARVEIAGRTLMARLCRVANSV